MVDTSKVNFHVNYESIFRHRKYLQTFHKMRSQLKIRKRIETPLNSMHSAMTVSPSVCLLAWLRISLFAALFGISALHAAAPLAGDWWGSVTWVVDGDTVWVRPFGGGRPVPVRLEGIDAPEICQNGGLAARDALKRQLMRQRVLVRSQAHDKYGRVLARLALNGADPAARLVADGWVWSYQYRTGRGPYAALQRQAEAARLGLFAAGVPEEPAAFRKRYGVCPRPARRLGRR